MSEREEPQRSRVPEYDRFGFGGHFEPACGSDEDRSSAAVLRELNRSRSSQMKSSGKWIHGRHQGDRPMLVPFSYCEIGVANNCRLQMPAQDYCLAQRFLETTGSTFRAGQ